MSHTCGFFSNIKSLLFSLFCQHSNWNPIIDHSVPRLLQKPMKGFIMLTQRSSHISSRGSFNPSENFRQCHQIGIRALLHQVMFEFRVSRAYDFEPLSWQTVCKVRHPPSIHKNISTSHFYRRKRSRTLTHTEAQPVGKDHSSWQQSSLPPLPLLPG